MTTFSEAWDTVQEIEGWLSKGQARMLYAAAARVPRDEAIVEIGSHHGRSTVIIAAALQDSAKFVAVDPFDNPRWGGGEAALDIFRKNLAERGLSERVQLTREYGADAGRLWQGGPVGMLFVDGAHDFPTVEADLNAWMPHLSPSGIILMHDTYSALGVTRVAFAHMFRSREFAYVGSSRTLAAFRRGELGAGARTLSSARMVGRLPYLARNLTIKVARRQGWNALPPLLGHRMSCNPY